MPNVTPPWQPADKQAFFTDYMSGLTNSELSIKHGGSHGQVVHYLRYLRETENLSPRQPHRTHHLTKPADDAPKAIVVKSGMNADGSKSAEILTNEEPRSPEELMALYNLDPAEWEVISFTCEAGTWMGFWKDTSNEAQTKTLYRYCCKGYFKPVKKLIRDIFADARGFLAEAREYVPKYPAIVRPQNYRSGEHCLEIDIPDLHLGKLCWSEETGFANYDVAIAENLFFEALESAIKWGCGFDLSRIVFPIGNDLLNCDNSENLTTAGTPQSADGRQKKTFRRTRKMLVAAIERLREIAEVQVLVVPGNHDSDSAFYLGDSVQCWFRNTSDVSIDNSAHHRKSFEWGANGILLTHGEEKEADLALTFASDFPDLWARTSYREVQCGHIHTTKVRDYRGCQVRYIGSLTGTDYWHSKHNYKSRRTAQFFVWQHDGLESYVKNFNVADDRVLRAAS
jgi:predicted phosphodiesterase